MPAATVGDGVRRAAIRAPPGVPHSPVDTRRLPPDTSLAPKVRDTHRGSWPAMVCGAAADEIVAQSPKTITIT